MNITLVAGARPNFMKVAPIIKELKIVQDAIPEISFRLVHTGQHYDHAMSGAFFAQLGIPEPDVNLGAGGGTQAEQTAAIMVKFEEYLLKHHTDFVLVVGDVTSTMACTITAKKLGIDVGHVEGGIRSGDMSMPEEINRIVTDSICDHFYTTSEVANQNLLHLGVDKSQIHFVGNTMIDSLMQHLDKVQQPEIWQDHSLKNNGYFLLTLHRPSNVDDVQCLSRWLEVILESIEDLPVIFPVHPRTKKMLDSMEYSNSMLIRCEPMTYLEFIYLLKNARGIITDSGGITEEATMLKVPCMTLRNSTERPETIELGTNILIGDNYDKLRYYLKMAIENNWKSSSIPPLWDGNSSKRIVEHIVKQYSHQILSSSEISNFPG